MLCPLGELLEFSVCSVPCPLSSMSSYLPQRLGFLGGDLQGAAGLTPHAEHSTSVTTVAHSSAASIQP